MEPYKRLRVQQKINAAVSAEEHHRKIILCQELRLIEAQWLLARSKRLLEDAIASRITYQQLLEEPV